MKDFVQIDCEIEAGRWTQTIDFYSWFFKQERDQPLTQTERNRKHVVEAIGRKNQPFMGKYSQVSREAESV